MITPTNAGPSFAAVAGEIEGAIAGGAIPGAVILVSRAGRIVYHAAFGARSLEPERTPMETATVFDLSSLTKPLATTTAVMLLIGDGKLRLDDRVTRYVPNFGVHGKSQITVRHLLAHCSGLPAWRPYFQEIRRVEHAGRPNFVATRGAKEFVYEHIHRERLECAPGAKSVYSDLGFMLLGELVEILAHVPLDRFCHERIFRPLGLRSTAFVDLVRLRLQKLTPITERIAPTERCPWRKRILCGEVHDDNAYAMGGVAGHAGLFASAADIDALVSRLRACHRGEDRFVAPDLVQAFWSLDGTVDGSTWALGWDTPSADASSAGRHLSHHAVGHLGFTGTSLWIDLERDLHVILLTNRVHPTRDNERIRDVRPRVHDAVMEAVGR
jgi:CubicO group peptidase (beta-lactamase class C family)